MYKIYHKQYENANELKSLVCLNYAMIIIYECVFELGNEHAINVKQYIVIDLYQYYWRIQHKNLKDTKFTPINKLTMMPAFHTNFIIK